MAATQASAKQLEQWRQAVKRAEALAAERLTQLEREVASGEAFKRKAVQQVYTQCSSVCLGALVCFCNKHSQCISVRWQESAVT